MSDGLMLLVMHAVAHVIQMAGGLVVQSSLGMPLGLGVWMGGAWFLQGLSCEWVKKIIAPTLLCPLALNMCSLI